MSENKNTKCQNKWDTVEAILREKFIARNAFIKKTRKISNPQPNITG